MVWPRLPTFVSMASMFSTQRTCGESIRSDSTSWLPTTCFFFASRLSIRYSRNAGHARDGEVLCCVPRISAGFARHCSGEYPDGLFVGHRLDHGARCTFSTLVLEASWPNAESWRVVREATE